MVSSRWATLGDFLADFFLAIWQLWIQMSQKSGIPRYYPNGWAVKSGNFSGLHIAPAPDYSQIIKAWDGYGEKVEEPGEVRKAVERGLRAIAGGQSAFLDVRLKPVEQIVERSEG